MFTSLGCIAKEESELNGVAPWLKAHPMKSLGRDKLPAGIEAQGSRSSFQHLTLSVCRSIVNIVRPRLLSSRPGRAPVSTTLWHVAGRGISTSAFTSSSTSHSFQPCSHSRVEESEDEQDERQQQAARVVSFAGRTATHILTYVRRIDVHILIPSKKLVRHRRISTRFGLYCNTNF